MKARTARMLDMGARVLIFSRLHPDPSAGPTAALARLEALLKRATQLARQERDGIVESHTAATRKHELVRIMRRGHLAHLRAIGRLAAGELPALSHVCRLRRGTIPYRTFRTAAQAMMNEALVAKEVLVKHGLSEAVLESLIQSLDEFDYWLGQGAGARLIHISASAELDAVTDEVVQIVKGMDGANRVRFAHQAELLIGWQSASHVVAAPRTAEDQGSAA